MTKESMKTDHDRLMHWAEAIQDTKQRRKAKRIFSAIEEKSKPIALYTWLHSTSHAETPYGAINTLVMKGLEKSDALHSCDGCGTRLKVSYTIGTQAHKDDPAYDRHIGEECIRLRLQPFGLNAKVVIDDAQQRRKAATRDQTQRELEELVLSNQAPELFYEDHDRADPINEKYVRNHLNWLADQKISKRVRTALEHLRDPLYEKTREDTRIVLAEIAKRRKVPSSAYGTVIDDLRTMGHQDLADKLSAKVDLSGVDVGKITKGVDYRGYRIQQNEFMRASVDFGKLINESLPLIKAEHERYHEGKAFGESHYEATLASDEYKTVSGALKRWAFGKPEQIAGMDLTRLGNIAVRVEPVRRFKDIIDTFTTLHRKFDYLRSEPDKLEPKVLLQQKCLLREHVGDGIEVAIQHAERSYIKNDAMDAVRARLPIIKEALRYDLVRETDVKLIERVEEARDSFAAQVDRFYNEHRPRPSGTTPRERLTHAEELLQTSTWLYYPGGNASIMGFKDFYPDPGRFADMYAEVSRGTSAHEYVPRLAKIVAAHEQGRLTYTTWKRGGGRQRLNVINDESYHAFKDFLKRAPEEQKRIIVGPTTKFMLERAEKMIR